MMQDQTNAGFSDHNRSRIGFGVAITMVVSIFFITVPIIAYLVGGFLRVHRASAPRFPAFVIANSPWLPLLIGVAAFVALLVKERWLKSASAAKANIIAIIITLLVGGFTLVTVILPMEQIIRALSR
jgi:hypothetical protein